MAIPGCTQCTLPVTGYVHCTVEPFSKTVLYCCQYPHCKTVQNAKETVVGIFHLILAICHRQPQYHSTKFSPTLPPFQLASAESTHFFTKVLRTLFARALQLWEHVPLQLQPESCAMNFDAPPPTDSRAVDHQREPCPHRIVDGMSIQFR